MSTAAEFVALTQTNFQILTEELFQWSPTFQNGAPNTVIGPPTSGERVLGELWKDSLGGWWKGINRKIKTMLRMFYGLRDDDFLRLKLYALHEAKHKLVG